MRRTVACLLFLLLPFAAALGASDPGLKADRLTEAARAARLHESRYWNVLLHYKPAGNGVKSIVDDPRFFLARDGKTNPESELAATIATLFGDQAPPSDNVLPARCRFPARFEWLSDQLGLPLPPSGDGTCGELDNALRIIDPRSATLVFASAHINSPSSMAGHTFLRIDGAHESPLLSWAVNYAAKPDPSDTSLVYALKGLTGYYPGYYSILPYYEKVKEYGDLERRDLWEYRLNLSRAEVRRMTLHVLEMRDFASDYYFFDENCSYNLLFLLEAARPAVRLTDRKGPWVLPVETIEWVREAGLVDNAAIRLSPVRTIRSALSGLPAGLRKQAPRLVDGTLSPAVLAAGQLPAHEKAVLLESAASRLQLQYAAGDIPKDQYQKRFLAILSARSAFGEDTAAARPPAPGPELPESGHPAGRLSFAAGVDRHGFAELGYRPAYHALDDPGRGFAPGAQILFLDTRIRILPAEETVRLSRLDVLDILSAAPRDALFKPWSWKLRAGLFDRRFEDGSEHLRTLLNPGIGLAWETGPGVAYAMAEAEGVLSPGYDKGWTVGAGATLGFAGSWGERWPVHMRGRWIEGVAGDLRGGREREIALSQGFGLTRTQSLTLDVQKTFEPGRRETSARLSWNRYF
ncbi:MAG TPA: DUF4105 domain-containing protein [Candidatus Deferrimicrobiaceae bacterium]|jgi:hypothetical protein